jgi:hypothetical protein
VQPALLVQLLSVVVCWMPSQVGVHSLSRDAVRVHDDVSGVPLAFDVHSWMHVGFPMHFAMQSAMPPPGVHLSTAALSGQPKNCPFKQHMNEEVEDDESELLVPPSAPLVCEPPSPPVVPPLEPFPEGVELLEQAASATTRVAKAKTWARRQMEGMKKLLSVKGDAFYARTQPLRNCRKMICAPSRGGHKAAHDAGANRSQITHRRGPAGRRRCC